MCTCFINNTCIFLMHKLINSFFPLFSKLVPKKKNMEGKNEGDLAMLKKYLEKRRLKKRSYVSRLPFELWQKIFSYLTHQDVLINIATTCKYFNVISKSCIQRMKMEYQPKNTNQKYLMYEQLKQFSFLRGLEIGNNIEADTIDQVLWTVLKYCPLLRDLVILQLSSIDHIVQFGDKLQSLQIRDGRTDGSMPIMALTKLKNLKKLRFFNISIDEVSSNDFLSKLADNCEHLSSLSLGELTPKFSIPSIETFIEMKKEKLKSLSILDSLEWIPYLVECKQLKHSCRGVREKNKTL